MAWDNLKSAMEAVIKPNGNGRITGQIDQDIRNVIINSLGEHATFVGVATPSTNPGTPDGPKAYLAGQAGTYSNFGGTVIAKNGVYALLWDGSTWSTQTVLDVESQIENTESLIEDLDEQVGTWQFSQMLGAHEKFGITFRTNETSSDDGAFLVTVLNKNTKAVTHAILSQQEKYILKSEGVLEFGYDYDDSFTTIEIGSTVAATFNIRVQAVSPDASSGGLYTLQGTAPPSATTVTPDTGLNLSDLYDVPALVAGKILKVNPTGDALIWGDPSGSTVSWGDIAGTLSNQTDLVAELTEAKTKVYAPDLLTKAAEGQSNGFRVGKDVYNGTLEINQNVVTGLDKAVNIEFGNAGSDAYFTIDLTVSSSNLNMYRFIGYVKTSTTALSTKDIKCIYSSENDSYSSYRVNVSDFFYENGKAKLRIASFGSTSQFTIKASITKVNSSLSNGLDSVTISEPYTHGLTLTGNTQDYTEGIITGQVSAAGVVLYPTSNVPFTVTKTGTGTYEVVATKGVLKTLVANVQTGSTSDAYTATTHIYAASQFAATGYVNTFNAAGVNTDQFFMFIAKIN